MHTLTWKHTRKGTPMSIIGTRAQLQIWIMRIRSIYPSHPMMLDGRPI